MARVTITINTVPSDLPVGKAAGKWRYVLVDGGGIVQATHLDDFPEYEFPSVSDGAWTVRAARLAADGSQLWPEVSAPFTLPQSSGATVEVANFLTLSFS